MNFRNTVTAPFAADQVDLSKWLFTMTDEEYQAVATAHRALGTFVEDGVRGMVNVEAMGGALLIHDYREVQATKPQVEMCSPRTRMYLLHVLPVSIEVRWTMNVVPRTADTSTFSCTVDIVLPAALRVVAGVVGFKRAVRKHVEEETGGYAVDLTRKLRAGMAQGPRLAAKAA
jgi:hypothetical protein